MLYANVPFFEDVIDETKFIGYIDLLKTLYSDVEWLNSDRIYISWSALYFHFKAYHGMHQIRSLTTAKYFNNWENKFISQLAQSLPNLYVKTRLLKENQISYLESRENRGNDAFNTNYQGVGTSPNMSITDTAPPLDFQPAETLRIKTNTINDNDNYNYLQDAERLYFTNINLAINEFIDEFYYLFVNVVDTIQFQPDFLV